MAIERLGIVGSGIMGSGIAEVAAKAGVAVVLRSRKQETADAMVAGLERSLAKQVSRGKLEQAEADAALGRVGATADLDALAQCDLVVESVVEDLEVKKQLFVELDRIVQDRMRQNSFAASVRAHAAQLDGFRTVEFSWILEDNLDLLKPIEVFEGRLYRRYRLVARTVPSSS